MLAAGDALPPAGVSSADVDEYAAALLAFASWYGVRGQLRALSAGLASVLAPPLVLCALSPAELRTAVCGSPRVEWDAASLAAHVRVGAGHKPGDAAVAFFLEALVAMSQRERAQFLLFATGNPSLPPSGLAGLDPPLQLTRKDAVQPAPRSAAAAAAGAAGGRGGVITIDGEEEEEEEEVEAGKSRRAGSVKSLRRGGAAASAPAASAASAASSRDAAAEAERERTKYDFTEISSSACFHQLKLPPYSSLAVMRERLRSAVQNSAGLMDLS